MKIITQLTALLKQLGPKAKVLIAYLLAHKDQLSAVVALLASLLGNATATGPNAVEATHAECVDACKACGCTPSEAEELAKAAAGA